MVKNVLWTGGWDSTYRILDLVLNKNEIIQPYYILDERRTSTEMEIRTMEKIKDMIYKIDKSYSNNILPTISIDRNNISEDKQITDAYLKLKEKSHLGDQYDWLARYTKSLGIDNLELCVHKDDTVEGFIKNDVILVEDDNDKYYRLREQPSNDNLNIFSYYHFPLFDMSKLEMEQKSKESGFNHIMEVTWFCHSPYKNKPCGMCNPCRYTRDEGLGRRVPKPSMNMKIQRKIKGKLNGLKRKLGLN